MSPDVYLKPLSEMVSLCRSLPSTPLTARVRIAALAAMSLRYVPMIPDKNLPEHPYLIAAGLIEDAHRSIAAWAPVLWAEDDDKSFPTTRAAAMEEMHQKLFPALWTQYDIEQFKSDRIWRYEHRIDVNELAPLIKGKRCIDFGCGHGNFAHALVNRGAAFVLGLDYGKDSIDYASAMRDRLGVSAEKIAFRHATVYDCGEPDNSYDFAIQNGVFHHLDDEDRAYSEVFRVLRPGASFWIYTDGENAIGHHMYDACRLALENIPPEFIVSELKTLNLKTGLRYHLGDGFNAVYRHANYDALAKRLEAIGYEVVRRLNGGHSTDFDPDVVAADKWGKEKFGEGEIRVLVRKPRTINARS